MPKGRIVLILLGTLFIIAAYVQGQDIRQVASTTYDVQQQCSMGRTIEHRSSAYVHFTWTEKNHDILGVDRYVGYNCYDLNTCVMVFTPLDVSPYYSGYANTDVYPIPGGAAISFNDLVVPSPRAWIPSTYYDFSGSPPMGFFSPDFPSDIFGWYKNNGTGPANENLWPKIDLQIGTDIVLHMVATESDGQFANTDYSTLKPMTASYYRRVGPYGSGAGVWSPQRIVDTVTTPSIVVASSPVSDKVIIAWAAPCDYRRIIGPPYDIYENDVWYAVSSDQGINWESGIGSGSIHHEIVTTSTGGQNITQYQPARIWKAFGDLSALISTDDDAHVVWAARRWDKYSGRPYHIPGTRTYRRQAAIFHWSENIGAISGVVLAVWDRGDNCFPHYWDGDASKMSISECDGKLYVLYTQFGSAADPCSDADGIHFVMNGELYMTVSGDGGLTWDRPQNLTNTYSCDCLPGDCDSENWSSMARYGRPEVCDLYAGQQVLDILYINDKSAGGCVQPESGEWTVNPVMYMRYPCREPVPEPGDIIPHFPFPPWPFDGTLKVPITPGDIDVYDLVLENTGNVATNYAISTVEYTGSGWIHILGASGIVPAGVVNTETIQVEISAPSGLEDPATLTGEIIIEHSGPSGSETIAVEVEVDQTHGTISTSSGPSIYDYELKEMLDAHIPTDSAHSTVLIFTECYGGDKMDDFEGREGTTVISATSPGETAKYGGYHDDAAKALDAAPGRTSDDVHDAGVAGKDATETPAKQGPNASLEPTNPAGPIKSRHVLVYAGQPNAQDNADRDAIKANFAGDANTTVTTVGAGGAGDGYDHPGTQKGMKDALEEIGEQMNPDEQFILFVTDHGNIDEADRAPDCAGDECTSAQFSFPSSAIDAILNDPDNIPVITILAHGENTDSTTIDIDFPAESFFDVYFTDTIDLDGDGSYYGACEGIVATVPVDEGSVDWTHTWITVSGFGDLEIRRISLESGAIARLSGGGGCGDDPGDANDDGQCNVGDAVYLIAYIFKGGPAPPDMSQGDANGDCNINVGDAVYVISYVFKGGDPPICDDICEWPDK